MAPPAPSSGRPRGRRRREPKKKSRVDESDSRLTSPTSATVGRGMLGVDWEVPGEKCEECDLCEWQGEEFHVGDVVYVVGR